MASIPMVLQQIRRARREARKAPPESRFERFRDEYKLTLTAAQDLAGEDALDDVAAWAVEWTRTEGQLPKPEIFRRNTRRILLNHGVDIPDESPLAEP